MRECVGTWWVAVEPSQSWVRRTFEGARFDYLQNASTGDSVRETSMMSTSKVPISDESSHTSLLHACLPLTPDIPALVNLQHSLPLLLGDGLQGIPSHPGFHTHAFFLVLL